MITIAQVCQQVSAIKVTLDTMLSRTQQRSPAQIVNQIMPILACANRELTALYVLAYSNSRHQDDLAHRNTLLEQRLSFLEKNFNSSNMQAALTSVVANVDYVNDIQKLIQQCELVVRAVDSLNIIMGAYTLHFADNQIYQCMQDIFQKVTALLGMMRDFMTQLDYLINEHDSLRGRIASLEHSYSMLDAQAAVASAAEKMDAPLLDFDSPEAARILAEFDYGLPPLVLPSNTASPSASACSSANPSLNSSPRTLTFPNPKNLM